MKKFEETKKKEDENYNIVIVEKEKALSQDEIYHLLEERNSFNKKLDDRKISDFSTECDDSCFSKLSLPYE